MIETKAKMCDLFEIISFKQKKNTTDKKHNSFQTLELIFIGLFFSC